MLIFYYIQDCGDNDVMSKHGFCKFHGSNGKPDAPNELTMGRHQLKNFIFFEL